MKKIIYWILGLSLITLSYIINLKKNNLRSNKRPNILLIAVDDLNDWIGPLKGHPQALTPNIDKLAKEGMVFTNAHCQAPVCTPSRSSLMTSLYPSTTGLYFLNPDIRHSPIAKKNVLMPQRFQNEGYYVTGAGKLFHNGRGINEKYIPNYGGNYGGFGPFPEKKKTDFPEIHCGTGEIFQTMIH
jgi:arylsulfatase A-like enzyme